jgi:hypothetical protein
MFNSPTDFLALVPTAIDAELEEILAPIMKVMYESINSKTLTSVSSPRTTVGNRPLGLTPSIHDILKLHFVSYPSS